MHDLFNSSLLTFKSMRNHSKITSCFDGCYSPFFCSDCFRNGFHLHAISCNNTIKMHFNGVVTTDCMEMEAISKTIGTEKGAVATIKAGSDFAMISHTFERQKGAIKEIMHAIDSGELTEETIRKASERIERLKKKYLNWDNIKLEYSGVPEFVGGL